MSDLISRQDAIKPFCIASDGKRIPEVDCDNLPVEFSVEFIKKHLLSLPSAEPPCRYSEFYVTQLRGERDILQEMVKNMTEPKTGECEQCTYWDKLDYEAPRQGWCNQFEEWTDADEYCSRCAKMRGEEHEQND